MQFDEEERGFSFQKDGPLDMRMDQTATLSAKDVVNKLSEKKLGEIFKDFGEEKLWRKGARAIIEARQKNPIRTTKELKNIIETSGVRGKKSLHPATKIFQAIRIYVNREIETIESTLKHAIKALSSGGRIGVISFHSLEDRIVKNVFRDVARPIKELSGKRKVLEVLTKKPLVPTLKESRKNRRSRSAKLRFASKK